MRLGKQSVSEIQREIHRGEYFLGQRALPKLQIKYKKRRWKREGRES